MTKRVCKNCIYCDGLSRCRRGPPSIGDGGQPRWPKMNEEEDWCGEFKAEFDPSLDEIGR